jgi:predicted  nucleic acid-binding Zn-ribbon protein
MPSLKERVDRHDREIAAIRKLILTGMKMLVKSDQNLLRLEGDMSTMRREHSAFRKEMREEHSAFRKEMRELAAAQRQTQKEQRETERQLQAFIRSLRGGGNGHIKRRID